jgi:hypothetical protein
MLSKEELPRRALKPVGAKGRRGIEKNVSCSLEKGEPKRESGQAKTQAYTAASDGERITQAS